MTWGHAVPEPPKAGKGSKAAPVACAPRSAALTRRLRRGSRGRIPAAWRRVVVAARTQKRSRGTHFFQERRERWAAWTPTNSIRDIVLVKESSVTRTCSSSDRRSPQTLRARRRARAPLQTRPRRPRGRAFRAPSPLLLRCRRLDLIIVRVLSPLKMASLLAS